LSAASLLGRTLPPAAVGNNRQHADILLQAATSAPQRRVMANKNSQFRVPTEAQQRLA